MNQKAIWIIIGLMALAVVGVLTLQMSFINSSRQLNEEDFDKHVAAGLKRVSVLLENVENIQLNRYVNGFSLRQSTLVDTNGMTYQQQLVIASPLQQTMEAVKLKEAMLETPIEERIEVVKLDHFLKDELGHNLPFSYGVWSNLLNSFVIYNNHYIVPNESQAGYSYLKGSEYQTKLFPDERDAPVDDDRVGKDARFGPAGPDLHWHQISGPGQTSFDHASEASTYTHFSAEGVYELELAAVDAGGLQSSARLKVEVHPDAPWETFSGVRSQHS